MVQSLKENKNLKNALDAMKNTPIPVAVRTVDTGIGVKIPYVESSTVGEVAGKFSKASTAAKDDAYQLAKGTGKGGKGNSDLLDNTGRFKDAELQSKYDVYCERKYKNSEAPKEPLEWKEASEKWASIKEQGQEFSDESFNLFSQQYENAEREITIVTHEGTKVRVDAIASDEYGNVIIQEYKSSATAPYTTNQEKGFPELKNSGGKVVGEGKGDFSGGYEVPSGTRPQIVRPEGTTYFDE
ncbi:toxin [Bacillus cereus]|nr:toxin [Bacillus cereus]